jgi:hypothetical protein
MKPPLSILTASAVFVGTIAVLGVAIERQRAPSDLLTGPASWATCFNDSDPKSRELGVWTYEGHADWRNARAAIRTNFPGTFAFSFPPGRPEYKASDLGYCFYMQPGAPDAPPIKCRTGELRITAVDVPRMVTGSYSFELENGQRRALQFSAPYCPGPGPNGG